MSEPRLAWEPRHGVMRARAGGLTLFAWDHWQGRCSWWFVATPPSDGGYTPESPTALDSGNSTSLFGAQLRCESAAVAWLAAAAQPLGFSTLSAAAITFCAAGVTGSGARYV